MRMLSNALSKMRMLFSGLAGGQPTWLGTISYGGGGIDLLRYANNEYTVAELAYRHNPDVYACVSILSSATRGIPWVVKVYDSDQRKWRVLHEPEHPLARLLARPNSHMNGSRFREALVTYMALYGVAYVYAQRVGSVRQLWLLDPKTVKVEYGERLGEITSITYGESTSIPPSDVAILTYFTPDAKGLGMSPIMPVIVSAAIGIQGRRWNDTLLKNEGRLPGAFYCETQLSREAREALERFYQEQHSGALRVAKPLILGSGIRYERFSVTPTDMDFATLLSMSTVDICRAFCIPPEILGKTEQRSYQSYRQARLSFYQETVLPLMDYISDELTALLVPERQQSTVKIDYDRNEIEALADERADLWKRATQGVYHGFITPKQAAELVGMSPPDNPAVDEVYMTKNLTRIENV